MARVTLDDLNRMDPGAFAATLGDVFEHSPWIAEAAYVQRPFATLNALFQAMTQAVRDAGAERQGTLIRSHPDLAGKAAREGAVTADSAREQMSAGLDRLSEEEFAAFHRLNEAYRAKFNMPFVVCVRRHGKELILRLFEQRLRHDAATEREAAVSRNPPHRRVAARPAGVGAGSPQSSRAAFDPCARHPSRPSRRGRCKSNFSRSSPQANRA